MKISHFIFDTNIVNKFGYSWANVCQIEIDLIKKYGRKDLNEGTLVNLTDGGEGAYGRQISLKTKKQISDSVKKNTHWKNGAKHTEESILKIANAGKVKVINTVTNLIHSSIEEAALTINMRPNTLSRKLLGIRVNNTNFKYYI